MKLLVRFKFEILIFLLLGLVYFALRLPNLTLMPIFADEAIYIRWAQVMKAEPTLRFISLTDGKTPLFMWLMIPMFKIFNDPLLAGRLLSVMSGFATMVGAGYLGWKFFGKQVGFWAAFLVTVSPFMFFFDRLALVDSMFASFSLWSLIFAIILSQNLRLDLSFILGYLLGASILVKTPGMFNFLSVPVTIFSFKWLFAKSEIRTKQVLKLFGLWVVSIGTGMAIYNILRLGPGFVSLSSRNQDYVFSPLRLLQYPLDPLIPHLKDTRVFFMQFLGLPVFALILLGVGFVIYRKHRVGMAVLLWSLVPLFIEFALLRTFTARYILFTIPPLLVLAGFGVTEVLAAKKIWGKLIPPMAAKMLISSLIIIWPVFFAGNLLTNPAKAPLPPTERRGYLEDWTAGYGFPQIAEFLKQRAKETGLAVVGTEGSFGTLPDGLQIYLDKNRDVIVIGGKATVSAQLRQTAFEHPTYFVTNGNRFPNPSNEYLRQVMVFEKASGGLITPTDTIVLYEVLPVKDASPSAEKE